MKTLLQQRIAIERNKSIGVVLSALGFVQVILLIVSGAVQADFSGFAVAHIILAAILGVIGALGYRRGRAAQVVFEAQEGKDAGRQEAL